MPISRMPCKHDTLRFECSEHAQEVGYKARTPLQRLAATIPSNKAPKKADRLKYGPSEEDCPASTFPAPLVLPGDELSWDPEYDSQSLKSWIEEPDRNEVTPSQRTIYLVPPPSMDASPARIKDWAIPCLPPQKDPKFPTIRNEDVLDYLKAFYHPLPVKLLTEPQLRYTRWPGKRLAFTTDNRIGLDVGGSKIACINTRPSKDGIFSGQLNLNDLLDVAISILPKDAYAILMLVDHDLYEDEDDDFCCGRAYGGSRVAVVSTARYNPALDEKLGVEREHTWPASHCQAYIDSLCGSSSTVKKTGKLARGATSAMHAAVASFTTLPSRPSEKELSNLWLSRLCKTASHELGHCFGIDHCVYYACIMQGTAGLSEDARQPPYLCPVDLAKVLRATGADQVERYQALMEFCGRFEEDRMFAAFGRWLAERIEDIEEAKGRAEVVVID